MSTVNLDLDHPSISHFIALANSSSSIHYSDVTLRLPSSEHELSSWSAHCLLLAAHSPFLKSVLAEHGSPEECIVTLANFDPDQIEDVLAFVYRGQVPEKESRPFYEACRALGIGETANNALNEEDTDASRPQRKRKRARFHDEESDTFDVDANTLDSTKMLLAEDRIHDENKLLLKKKVRKRSSKKKPDMDSLNKDLECCDEKFDDEIIYATHKENVHMERLEGDRFIVCCDQKIFGDLQSHLRAQHSLDADTQDSKCCDTDFQGLPDLTKHLTATHGLKVTNFKRILCCATQINTVDEYLKHREKGAADHMECSQAQCTFLSRDKRQLTVHLYNKHKVGSKPDDESVLTCKYCHKTFKHVHLRQDHEDKHDDSYKYDCATCGKEFKFLSSLKSHIYRMGKNHNPSAKEYACDECDKVFTTIAAKRKHTLLDHQKKDGISCEECDLVFIDKHRFETHNKVAHLKVKDIQCTYCGKLFATQERMRVHEKFVHVVEAKGVPCDICNKEFVNRYLQSLK